MIYGRELPGYPYDLKAKMTRCIVAGQRILFGNLLSGVSDHAMLPVDLTGSEANDAIYELLMGDSPCLVARFGSGEMETILRGIDVRASGNRLSKLVRMCCGKSGPFWRDNSIRAGIVWNAGYFPETNRDLEKFADCALEDSRQIDLLGCWLAGEKRLKKTWFPNVVAVPLDDLEPFWHDRPWTKALEGKRVLVVHPSSDTIRMQYDKRKRLFRNPDVLPDFELLTYRSVQSAIGLKTPHKTWFDALNRMTDDISKLDFDIAIIGAGAYGMSIGAYVKRELGKKALHLGGITQLLFGIKGRRWDARPKYTNGLYNDAWSRPLDAERPQNFMQIESGGYW